MRLNPRVIYTLYWGDVPGYGRYSPVAFLAAGVYASAREKGFRLMATGTVPSIRSGPAAGLIKFKENLGRNVLFPKRLGHASELASMVAECITNDYMNGETLRVDGGIRMPPK